MAKNATCNLEQRSDHEKSCSLNNFEEKICYYIAVTNPFALLTGISSKHNNDVYCLNVLH